MIDHKNHFPRAYDLSGQEETNAFYSDWAETYDAEVIANGYRSPARCADALARVVGHTDIKILEIGCGTGFAGAALRTRGFSNISGTDPNPDMLALAKKRNVYTENWPTNLNDPYPFAQGTYSAIAAIGVIGSGAAPASVLEQALDALGASGLMVFSFNDHTLDSPTYTRALDRVLANGHELLLREYGPHLVKQGVGSDVLVIRKL